MEFDAWLVDQEMTAPEVVIEDGAGAEEMMRGDVPPVLPPAPPVLPPAPPVLPPAPPVLPPAPPVLPPAPPVLPPLAHCSAQLEQPSVFNKSLMMGAQLIILFDLSFCAKASTTILTKSQAPRTKMKP